MIPLGIDLGMGVIDYGGVQVTYTSPWGATFTLWGDHYGAEGVILLEGGLAGGESSVDLALSRTVRRIGARPKGHTIDPLEGAITVLVADLDGNRSGEIFRNWRRSWSPLRDGTLTIVAESGVGVSTRVRATGVAPAPERDVYAGDGLEDTIKWVGLDGCWSGTPRSFSGTTDVVVDGDLSPSCRLWWDGQATSFTTPGGVTHTLPGLSSVTRFVDLTIGMVGHVTLEDGSTDDQAWSSLRGLIGGVELEPHVPSQWQLGAGLTLEVTPRYLSPWR